MRKLLKGPALGLALLLCALPGGADAQARYIAPDGCKPLATLRLPNCIVRQVSACEDGNISDTFHNGSFVSRARYGHPSLFLHSERADGVVAGHEYGPGAPRLGDVLEEGQRFEYTRSVYRSAGAAEPGDEGIETMEVGRRVNMTLGGKQYPVRDIRFEVGNDDGYRYVERALMLVEPELTLGVLSRVFGVDGEVETTFSSLPEVISLEGDPDFMGFAPAPSCLPTT